MYKLLGIITLVTTIAAAAAFIQPSPQPVALGYDRIQLVSSTTYPGLPEPQGCYFVEQVNPEPTQDFCWWCSCWRAEEAGNTQGREAYLKGVAERFQ